MTFPWLEVVDQARRRWGTPFYLAAWQPVQMAIDELAALSGVGIPVRHWLSVKTQPVKPLLLSWRRLLPYGVEVVSQFELLAVKEAGFKNEDIVVNGPGKHAWLPEGIGGLHVHLDSLQEVVAIGPRRLSSYRLGLRCHVAEEYDPDEKSFGAQFGVVDEEASKVVEILASHKLELEGIHFHLRSNVRDVNSYGRALEQGLKLARELGIAPKYVDCGGGLPSPGELIWEEGQFIGDQVSLPRLADRLKLVIEKFPSVRELWFENGKYVTSRAGVLVVQILDIKERRECRYLICDGGRTNHALPSDWQEHNVATLPRRTGPEVLTTICGPTCMAYDRLRRVPLPRNLAVGDYLIWFNAGAYHIPWETRFSHGLSNVVWCDEHMELSLARGAESFKEWWGQWA